MGKLRNKEERKVAKVKARPSAPLKPIKVKLRFTKVKQTILKSGAEPVTTENEVAHSKAKVLAALRSNQPVTSEFIYNLNKKGFAERVLADGSIERLEITEEIREIKLGAPPANPVPAQTEEPKNEPA